MENKSENNHGRNDDCKFLKTLLRLIFSAGGLMLLFNGSFFKNQFEDGASLKGMFFIILSLGVGLFVFVPEECNHKLEKLCNSYFLLNALVKFLLLGLFSMSIFFNKYPALKIHRLEGKRSEKVYDFLGAGSFSLFALLISWERQHGAAGFGVFEFMLGLTVDTSMDIPAGDGSMPNYWYMVGAYVYCLLLLTIRCYGNHSLSMEEDKRGQEKDGRGQEGDGGGWKRTLRRMEEEDLEEDGRGPSGARARARGWKRTLRGQEEGLLLKRTLRGQQEGLLLKRILRGQQEDLLGLGQEEDGRGGP